MDRIKDILELKSELEHKKNQIEELKKFLQVGFSQMTNKHVRKTLQDNLDQITNEYENKMWCKQPHESNFHGAKFDAFKEKHQKRLEYIKKLKNYDNDDYDDYNHDNDNDENDDDHGEAAMLKKLRLDELEKRYGLENHSHELEKLKKKNQSLQDTLRVAEDLLASKLIDLRNKDRYIEALKEENRKTVVENQETIENILKENDRLRHELNEIRETVTVTATLKYKLQMRSKKE